jgi:hypothetical protein
VDLDVHTRRPEREHTCPACRWDWPEGEAPPDHTCRTPPTTPRTTTEAQRRADDQAIIDREGRVRAERLLNIRRGYAG